MDYKVKGRAAELGVDFSKFYASCLYKSKYDFLVFNEYSQVEEKPNDTDFKFKTDCVYYVCKEEQYYDTDNPIPIDRHMCADWYYPELIKYWLKHKLITMTDLRYRIRASETIPTSRFREFIEFTFNNIR